MDAKYPSKIEVNRFVDASPEDYNVLKQQFGGLDVDKSNVLSAVKTRLSEIDASRKDPEEVLVTNGTRKRESKGEGIRCLFCNKVGHYARDYLSRKHAKGSKRGPSRSPSAGPDSSNLADEESLYSIGKSFWPSPVRSSFSSEGASGEKGAHAAGHGRERGGQTVVVSCSNGSCSEPCHAHENLPLRKLPDSGHLENTSVDEFCALETECVPDGSLPHVEGLIRSL